MCVVSLDAFAPYKHPVIVGKLRVLKVISFVGGVIVFVSHILERSGYVRSGGGLLGITCTPATDYSLARYSDSRHVFGVIKYHDSGSQSGISPPLARHGTAFRFIINRWHVKERKASCGINSLLACSFAPPFIPYNCCTSYNKVVLKLGRLPVKPHRRHLRGRDTHCRHIRRSTSA